MDFWFDKTTPANTAQDDALETKLHLCSGTIIQVWMFHPEGCHGLAYASVHHGGHQLYPNNPEKSYHGNAVPMTWSDNYKLGGPPILKLKTWNLDDTYDHTVYVRVTVLRPEESPGIAAMLQILRAIQALLTGRRIG